MSLDVWPLPSLEDRINSVLLVVPLFVQCFGTLVTGHTKLLVVLTYGDWPSHAHEDLSQLLVDSSQLSQNFHFQIAFLRS